MTIAKAQKKFEKLKNTILEDGKIDLVETYALLDFAESYVRSDNRKFTKFAALLKQCAEDKVITKQESDDIIEAINEVSRFLKVEAIIEYVFFGGLMLIGLAAGIMFCVKGLLR